MPIFALFLGAGTATGLIWSVLRAKEREIGSRLVDALLVLLGALALGRLVFTALTWEYFQAHLIEIPQVWLGGFSGPGALAGGLIVLCLAAVVRQVPLGVLADTIAPLAVALAVSAWLACWSDGAAYGKPAESWFRMPARDEWGELSMRWPTQLTGAFIILAVSGLYDRFPPRHPSPGLYASLVLLCLGISLFTLSFTRGDPALTWKGLRLDAWAGLFFTLIATSSLGIVAFRRRRPSKLISSVH
ncbi:MAG: hypothetical protein EHM41_21265 [Chloroflexi bacterium]|nr:MAG: hypothetical protein EHM41_21265 [Chloroflexota bacterium]